MLEPEAARPAPQPAAGAFWHRMRQRPLAVAGGVVTALLYLIAIFAPVIAPYDPNAIDPGAILQPPGPHHLLGTDNYGRDLLSRIIFGARASLFVGFVAVAIIVVVGVSLGAASGYLGGTVDMLIMRVVDVFLSIPTFFLLLTVVAVFGQGLLQTMVVIGLTSWMSTARLVRGQFLALRDSDFATAARALGGGGGRIVLKHLLPNTMAVIIVQATLYLSYAVLIESSLSYLGLGVQPPTASWGNILADGQHVMLQDPYMTTFAGVAIFITVMAFNLLGDGLRDALDPRLRGLG
jgi:peptide/nickel transport system permease protein